VPPTAHSLLNPRARPPTSPAGFACRNPCALDRAQEARPVRLALMGGGVRAHCVSLQPEASQGCLRGSQTLPLADLENPRPPPLSPSLRPRKQMAREAVQSGHGGWVGGRVYAPPVSVGMFLPPVAGSVLGIPGLATSETPFNPGIVPSRDQRDALI